MALSILDELGVNSADVFALGKSDARSVVNLLLRWEAWQDAWAVLEHFGDDGLVTTMDARARVLLGQGRADEAVALLQQRLEKRESSMPQVYLARALLAQGRGDEAVTLLEPLTDPSLSYWWAFSALADAYFAQGNIAAAERFAHTYRDLSPNSRYPDLILAQVALAKGDRIGASAYATRAMADGEQELTPEQLRTLRDLFAAIPDEVRLRETQEQLADLRSADLDELRAMLEAVVDTAAPPSKRTGGTRAAPPPRERKGGALRGAPQQERPVVTDIEAVPVSEEEMAQLSAAAQRLFGFGALRPWQPQILAAVSRNEDVLAILPTGGGKSLCYQLPAFVAAEEAAAAGEPAPLTLVISPLIALMQDQVQGLPPVLRRQSIALNSALGDGELGQALRAIEAGEYSLVYVAPERLRQRPFVEAMRRRGVGRLVIDEAHCVSSWGHNFRPDYLHIAQAHQDMGAPPILAMTATAPTRVREDIETQLFRNVRVEKRAETTERTLQLIAGDSYRDNLCMSVELCANAGEKRERTMELCVALEKPGLVYARSRRDCEEIAGELRRRGVNADHYHAGRYKEERAAVQEAFLANQVDVLVATVAFGMGVDKPDIRFILHHGLASSLEAYYQEAGRAGRDGKPSTCVLLYTSAEKSTMKSLRRRDALDEAFLRSIYGEAQRLMGGRNPGSFALEELVRAVSPGPEFESDTRVRVGLSALEEAGALRRHYDVPDRMTLLPSNQGDAAYRDFLKQSELTPGEPATVPFVDFCTYVGLHPATAEAHLLQWQAQGSVDYMPQGRKALVTLVRPAPEGLKERVKAQVERSAALLEQQADDVFNYARSRRCRHGHIAAALGGVERRKCESCDICGATCVPASTLSQPEEREISDLILLAVGKRGIGKLRLVRLLRADRKATETDQTSPQFGSLRMVGETKLLDAIERMVVEQMLVEEEYQSGAVVVKVGPSAAKRQRELDTHW